MKHSKKDKLQQMEYEDANGIRRDGKQSYFALPLYWGCKVILLIALPVIYFLYSPLLIVVAALYAAMYFATRSVEKSFNHGLRRDMHVHLVKVDSVLCALVIILAIAVQIINLVSSSQHASPISDGGEYAPSAVSMVFMQITRALKNIGSLQTGTRYLFVSEDTWTGFTPPSSGKSLDITEMLQELPLTMLFEMIIRMIITIFLILTLLIGLFSLWKLRKVQKELEIKPESFKSYCKRKKVEWKRKRQLKKYKKKAKGKKKKK